MLIGLFALTVATMVFLLLFWFVKNKVVPQKELNERLKALEQDKSSTERSADSQKAQATIPNFRERVLIPLEQNFGRLITNFAPASWSAALEKKLTIAGKGRAWTPQGYALGWVCSIFTSFLLSLRYVQSAQHLAAVQSMMVVLLVTMMGAALPWMVLRIMIQKRQRKILRQLPEVLDLLCISVQAGLGFDAALRRIVERMEGPLIEEYSRMLDDVRMGLHHKQALRMMAERCDVQEVTLFVTAIIQAERLGTSIGKTLSSQAFNMRERRRQRVKAEAMKAPVKMIFPLVLFIFPAIFVIVLLPSLLSMMKNFIK